MNKQIESIMLYHLETCIETFRWNAGSDNYEGLSVRFVKESLVTGYQNTIQDVKKIIEKTASRKTKRWRKNSQQNCSRALMLRKRCNNNKTRRQSVTGKGERK